MRSAITLFIIGTVVGLIVAAGFSRLTADDGRYVDTSRTAVVQQVRDLGRLETTVYSIEKIVEAGTGDSGLREFLFGDKLLLIARGDVIAGVDLAGISSSDITVEDTALTIAVPAPEIFTAALVSGETRVYDRSQGLFARADKDLETEARVAAEAEIRSAACASGILDEAAVSARKQLTTIFLAAGFTQVTVEVPQGSCE